VSAARSARGTAFAAVGVAAALPVVGFLSSGAALAAEPSSIECNSGAVFIVAGTDDLAHVNTRLLEARYGPAGKDYAVTHVDYPATFWPLGAQSYDANIEVGKAELVRAVKAYQAACDTPVVIIGYSQGARIAGDVLADIETHGIESDGLSGELYSDPRRAGDGRGAGAEVNFAGAYPGVVLDGERDGEFGVPVYSVCIEGDPVCDLPDLLHDPIGAIDALIGFFTKHATYGQYMGVDPVSYGAAIASPVTNDDAGARVVMIKADPALTTILDELGLPNLFTLHFVDLPYPDLAILQPIAAAVLNLLPQLPDLGHGAYLTDLFVLRDVLQGNPAAWKALFGSAISVVGYPFNFVADWTGVLDDLLEGQLPDFGFIASPALRAVAIRLGELLTTAASDYEPAGRHAVRAHAPVPADNADLDLAAADAHPVMVAESGPAPVVPSVTQVDPVFDEPATTSVPEVDAPGGSPADTYGKHAKPDLPADEVSSPVETVASDEPVVEVTPPVHDDAGAAPSSANEEIAPPAADELETSAA
jgi:hypothetical protein